MSDMITKVRRTIIVVGAVGLMVAACSDVANLPARPAEHTKYLKVVCLNGVEYWKDNDRDARSESYAPKYSPGNAAPDTCDE